MKVAVIGAGMAGLTAAWRAQQAGHTVTVFEAQSAAGGRTSSTMAGGFMLDLGAYMLLDCYDRTRALVEEMGLGAQWTALESAQDGGILRAHAVTSFSPKGAFDVLRYQGLPLSGRLGLFLALLEARRWRDELDFFDLSTGDDALDDEDCRTFALRRMGQEATDYVVDTFIRTFHFHGAHKMSRKYFEALAVLLARRGQFQPRVLQGHMRALPDALAARLSVTRGAAVRHVTTDAGGVTVALPGGSARFDAAVVATSVDDARRLLPSPTQAVAALLAHASSSCTISCALSLPITVAGGFEGIWVPFVESPIISGLSNESAKGANDGERCAFTVWLHEEAAGPLLAASDGVIFGAVRQELERLFPRYQGQARPLHVQRWAAALPVYAPGQISRVRRFWADGQGAEGIWLCGDYLNHPWVEGAVRCGERVAAGLQLA